MMWIVALFCILGTALSQADYEEVYGNSRYLITNSRSNFVAAEAYCVTWGGHLATINDMNEQNYLWDIYGRNLNVWIGYNDRDQEGVWVWTSGETSSFTNWSLGQPNNMRGQDCVCFDVRDNPWNDRSCNDYLSFVCEKTEDYCPDSSWYYFGGHCYKIMTDELRWDDAMAACPALDPVSYLVQLETRPELNFLRNIFVTDLAGGPNKYWTSGHMLPQNIGDNSGTWYWGDGSTINAFFWGFREPNFSKGKEFCMNLLGLARRDFEENDSRCKKKQAYICERPT